jgi:hypothetical protein
MGDGIDWREVVASEEAKDDKVAKVKERAVGTRRK